MTKLECNVLNCFYNEDQLCAKDGIMVEGASAKDKEGTCCGSFRERTGAVGTNSLSGNARPETDVECEACQCTFNDDCKCHADSIGIGGGSACNCEETCCASFRQE